jgi:cytochrome c
MAGCVAVIASMAAVAAADTAASGEARSAIGGGDPLRGRAAFQKCYACHSTDPDETGLPGPNLHRIVGRAAATRPGFDYSPAMLDAARRRPWTWSAQALDGFLADPEQWLPGTSMGFVGLRDPAERADVIAYLEDPVDD